MKIVQLTDLHVGLPGENTYGVDVRENFRRLLAAIQSQEPDALIISGDLSYSVGLSEIYHWIKSMLDAQGLPYYLIPGNHDDVAKLSEAFGLAPYLQQGELYYQLDLEEPMLLLDTTTGIVSPRQLAWLRDRLQQLDRELIVFMHHPPLLAGVPYMDDKYALQNWRDVLNIFTAYPHRLNVFCGHYHVHKTVSIHNTNVHLTPSCFFQIDWRSDAFQVHHQRIGYRWIERRADGALEHGVVYLDGSQMNNPI